MKFTSSLHRKAFLLSGMMALCLAGSSQNPSLKVFEDWRTQSGSQNSFYRAATINIPGTANSIVCGATINANGNYDMFVQQLNGAGAVTWSYQYDGPGSGDDVATDVCFDTSSGYTYVVGSYLESSADSLNAIVVALDPSGAVNWSATHNGSGSGADGFLDVEVDPGTGEIYCTGSEWKGIGGGMYDVLIAKYDAAGTQTWTNTYDHMAMIDGGYKFALSAKPKLMAAVQNGPTSFRYGVIDFDASDGSITGVSFSGGTMMGYDRASGITFDDTGNVYLVGSVYNTSTWSDIRVTKYDTMLNVVWEYDIDAGYNMDDYGAGIALDSHNNVIVVGTSRTVGNGLNYSVLKYSNAGGLRFFYSYNGAANGNDSAVAVAVSPNDTDGIYITGYSYNGSTNDYWTMRLDGLGNSMWDIHMNSYLNGDDKATAIVLDTLGDVIVTGQTRIGGAIYDYTTTRYLQKNILLAADTIAHTSSSFIYTENRDQIWGTDDATHPEVKYYVINSMPKIYFMDTTVAYVYAGLDTSTTTAHADTLARVDMKFVGANNDLRVRAMEKRDDYENFFLGHIPEGRSNVPNYDQLIYPQVWNGVDVIFGSNSAGMKYYFICKPMGGGSSVSQIDLYYEGADSVKIGASGELIIYTLLGNVVQPKAAAWQLDATGAFQPLGWQPTYSIIGTNEVSFSGFGSYNPSQPLVLGVDWNSLMPPPTNQDNLWWSTYMGGGYNDQFMDVKVDLFGKQLTGGATQSANFPVFNGVQMSNNMAYVSGMLMQFDLFNVRVWATYYGGSATPALYSQSRIEALDVDPAGDIFLTGQTNTTDFPLRQWGTAYYQDSLNNGCDSCYATDAFVAKISSNGQNLIWSTYWGGDSMEVAFDLHISALDPNDFYIGGHTLSTNNPFPNALPAWSGGTGFFMRFDYLGNDLYGSHIGNPGSGEVRAITVDSELDVLLCGKLGSGTAFPVLLPMTGNTGDATFNAGTGASDAFITKLDFTTSTPVIEWSMYYGGTSMSEVFYDIVTNPFGASPQYWLVGSILENTASGPPPLFDPGNGAYYDSTFSGGSEAVIMHIDVNGNIPWATYYGGNGQDRAFGVDIDIAENLYVTGESESSDLNSNGTFPSPNLFGGYAKTTCSGPRDHFLNCYAAGTFIPLWGTYYGGGGIETVPDIAVYQNSTLYLVGSKAPGSAFPLFSGPGCTGLGMPFLDGVGTLPSGGYLTKGSIAEFCLGPIFVGQPEAEPPALGVEVFPNPSEGMVTVTCLLHTSSDVTIEVRNIVGQVVYQRKIAGTTTVQEQIDFSGYTNGMYFVNVQAGERSASEKLILQR